MQISPKLTVIKTLCASLATAFLTLGNVSANDQFLGPWSAGNKEVLNITKDGESLSAEFIRENVKFEFEKVRFPAKVENGTLVIAGTQGNVTAQYDPAKNLLVIGGLKVFEKLSPEQAAAIIAQLETK